MARGTLRHKVVAVVAAVVVAAAVALAVVRPGDPTVETTVGRSPAPSTATTDRAATPTTHRTELGSTSSVGTNGTPSTAPPPTTDTAPPDVTGSVDGLGGSSPTAPPTSTGEPREHTIPVDGGGAFTAPAGVAAGSYTLLAAIHGGRGRIELTVGGAPVASFGVTGSGELAAQVHLRGPDEEVGVRGADGAEHDVRVRHLRLVPSAPSFTTRGADVLDPGGRPVVLRGVNRAGLNATARPENLTRGDFQAMRDRGVTIVRLKLGQHLWLPNHCAHDPRYVATVDRAVADITELGMMAMIDLAWTTAGDRCGEPGLQPMPDMDSVPFWREVATRYHANPLVAFNVFNEPGDVSAHTWRNGGVLTSRASVLRSRQWEAVGMQQLYDVVRATGARNLIFVTGTGYGSDLRPALSHPLDGFGIVLGAHIYCHGCDHLPPVVERGIEPAVGRLPVAVTEFGSTRPTPRFNQRVIDWAEARGLGWQAFMWAPRSTGAYGLLESWDTYEPSPAGRPVLAALARAAAGR